MTGRGLRGRRVARLMIVVASMAVAFVAFLLTSGPNFTYGHVPFDSWITWAGVVGVAIGFVWMIRIYRADPEGGPSSWRSHQS